MTTRRQMIGGLAGILAAGHAPAALIGVRGASFNVQKKPQPQPQEIDRFECDFYVESGVNVQSNYISLQTTGKYEASGVADGGDGNQFDFVSLGGSMAWSTFTGQTYQNIIGLNRRWADVRAGVVTNCGITTLASQNTMSSILRLKFPSYCTGVTLPTNSSRVCDNCTDVYFVGRTYSQAVAMHSRMSAVFANAAWHCSDGDFNADGTIR